jgi:TonB family protein
VPAGRVVMRFRIGPRGTLDEVQVVKRDSGPLGESCVAAFRAANPFPAPPPGVEFLVGERLVATFAFDPSSLQDR